MLRKVAEVLKSARVCDACLGRQFSMLSTSATNRARGRALKLVLAMDAHARAVSPGGNREEAVDSLRALASGGNYAPARAVLERLGVAAPEPDAEFTCQLCGDLFPNLDPLALNVLESLGEYQFDTFLIGTKLSPVLAEREDEFRRRHQLLHGEAFKSHLNRELGKVVQKRTNRRVDFEKPDVVVTVALEVGRWSVTVRAASLYVYGVYFKHKRGVPQTQWPCFECGGNGCSACGGTGKFFPTSVEELVSEPFLEASGASRAKFHGAGREDQDALCLGTGRPFVLELKNPKRRVFDLPVLEAAINEKNEGVVQVKGLRFCRKSVVKKIKEGTQNSPKTYEALCEVEGPMPREEFEEKMKLVKDALETKLVLQRTPSRVSHRRADRTRKKRVFWVEGTWQDETHFKLRVRTQGGTYVKELVSGDGGRTQPNVADLLGRKARCVELDVVEVTFVELDDGEDFVTSQNTQRL
ncbi:MAG: tRNA pseudouridine(54/55) synthase Pus10 [Promethearchaeota archaeon]